MFSMDIYLSQNEFNMYNGTQSNIYNTLNLQAKAIA